MRKYIIRRILFSFLVLFGVSVIVFGILRLTPGDPARLMLPEWAPEEEVNKLRETLGLNKPILVQYLIYMQGVIKGDLGTSLWFKRPNLDLIKERMPATLLLTGTAVLCSLLFSLPLGIIAGVKQGSFIDLFAMLFSILGQSMSHVWLGVLLIFTFSVKLKILPSFGYGSLKNLIMPAACIGYSLAALVTRLTRAGVVDILSEDYILSIRAKGIREKKIMTRYALKNVLIPITTVVGLQFATLLGGVVVTENIFSWPGIGQLTIFAIMGRDFPLVQSIMLVMSTFFVSINLLVDIIYTLLDPRLKFN